jgi:hypothetical protein
MSRHEIAREDAFAAKGEYPLKVAAIAPVLAELPDWLDLDFARTAAGVLAIVAVVVLLVTVFMVRSVAVRVMVVVLMGAAVFGLMRYRETLDHCDKAGCPCELFGEDLEGGGCVPAP